MIRKAKDIKIKMKADTWLTKNFETVVNKYAGRYLMIVDNHGIVFTDKDGSPREIALMAKKKYGGIPLFFQVPRPKDFICALNAR